MRRFATFTLGFALLARLASGEVVDGNGTDTTADGTVYTYSNGRIVNVAEPRVKPAGWGERVASYLTSHQQGSPALRPAATTVDAGGGVPQTSHRVETGNLGNAVAPSEVPVTGSAENQPPQSHDLVATPLRTGAPNAAALNPGGTKATGNGAAIPKPSDLAKQKAVEAAALNSAASRADRAGRRAQGLRDLLGRPSEDDSGTGAAPGPAGDSAATGNASRAASGGIGGSGPGAVASGGGFANPSSNSDLQVAQASGFSQPFSDMGLKMGALPGGQLGVLRGDGTAASAEQVKELKSRVASEPKALLTRPDLFKFVSREKFGALKSDFQERPELKDSTFRHVGLTGGARDFAWSESCSKVSGSCNRNAAELSYQKGKFVSPEDLAKMSKDAAANPKSKSAAFWENLKKEDEAFRAAQAAAAGSAPKSSRDAAKADGSAEEPAKAGGVGAFFRALSEALTGGAKPEPQESATSGLPAMGDDERLDPSGAPRRRLTSPGLAPEPGPRPVDARHLRFVLEVLFAVAALGVGETVRRRLTRR